ncbi:zinc-ribbon domain-containing protein [Actinobacillus porcinus]|uniref:zinc-ribbon domain-containing protein n=1 Tax=Actinobacillus porcinus TaxID=51048 RepID=UPI00235252B7|nr:zinc-ribbon domain-containing protein [Actinobacillus porcinus]
MFCSQCGKNTPDNAKFCPNCGTPVYQATEKTQQKEGKTQEQANTKKNEFEYSFSSNNTPLYQRILALNGEFIFTLLLIVIPNFTLTLNEDVIIVISLLLPIILRLIVYAFSKKTIWGNILGFEYVDKYNKPISILKYSLRLFLKVILLFALSFIFYIGSTVLLISEFSSQNVYFSYILAPIYLLGLAAIPFLLLIIGSFFQWQKKDYAPHMFYDRWLGIQVQKTKNSRAGYSFTLVLIILLIALSINSVYQENKKEFSSFSNDAEQCYTLFNQKKYEEAFPFCLSAANTGDAQAQNLTGRIYRRGIGSIERNDELALYYLEQSLNQGYIHSYVRLGDFYLVNKNSIEMAKYYYEMAVNHDDAFGLVRLGDIYNYYTSEPDFVKAKAYYEQAIAKGDVVGYYGLAQLYYYGNGVEQNYSLAKQYYEYSTKMGDTTGYLKIGDMYYYGNGVPKNEIIAKQYYELAPDQDEANYKLGMIYTSSKNIAHDEKKAQYYFELADKTNHQEAQLRLGHIYRKRQDYTTAKYYYEKSAKQGNETAKKALKKLKEIGR